MHIVIVTDTLKGKNNRHQMATSDLKILSPRRFIGSHLTKRLHGVIIVKPKSHRASFCVFLDPDHGTRVDCGH